MYNYNFIKNFLKIYLFMNTRIINYSSIIIYGYYVTGDDVISFSSEESVFFSCDETDEDRTGRLKLSSKGLQ